MAAMLLYDILESTPEAAFQRFDIFMRTQQASQFMPQPSPYDPYGYGQPARQPSYYGAPAQQPPQQSAYMYQQPQTQYPATGYDPVPAVAAGTLGLGMDGTAGQLLPATSLSNGQQVSLNFITYSYHKYLILSLNAFV